MRKRTAKAWRRRLLAMLLTAGGAAAPALAVEYAVDGGRSVFAVLTHKSGIASGLAHDHLIVAVSPAVTLDFDPSRWFQAADGTKLAPGSASSAAAIEANIRASIRLVHDDDRDGHDDEGHD